MSEFPFPPERLWVQYEAGVAAGPPPPAPVIGDFAIFNNQLQTAAPAGLLEAASVPKLFASAKPGDIVKVRPYSGVLAACFGAAS